MVARRAGRLSAACAAAISALGIAICSRGAADALPRGEQVPLLAGGARAAPVAVVWVLRPDDFLTCQTAADGVRQLQLRFGGALPVRVIHVGPHPEWVRGFLRRQRIDAGITWVSEQVYRLEFNRAPGAWIYLVRRGVVVDVRPGRGPVHPDARWEAQITAALGRGGAPRG